VRKIFYWIIIGGFILAGCDKDKDNIPDCSGDVVREYKPGENDIFFLVKWN
jgi:hypothetical protein